MKLSPASKVFIGVQTVLLLIELFAPYDDISRRIALAVTNVIACYGILLVEQRLSRKQASLPGWILAVAILGIWLDAVGNFFGWYSEFWWYDRFTHTIGGLALSLVAHELWQAAVGKGAIWVAVALGQMIGAWYEVSEFVGDMIFGTHRVGAGYDTSRDLCFNLLGGLVAAILLHIARRRQKVV